jgi:hypothetical protein
MTAAAPTRRVHPQAALALDPGGMRIQLAALGGLAAYFVWTTSLSRITQDVLGALGR